MDRDTFYLYWCHCQFTYISRGTELCEALEEMEDIAGYCVWMVDFPQ
jgi:hypothetical protein